MEVYITDNIIEEDGIKELIKLFEYLDSVGLSGKFLIMLKFQVNILQFIYLLIIHWIVYCSQVFFTGQYN